MPDTAAESAQTRDPIDQTIHRVETLYRTVTGHDAPPAGEESFGSIPPEHDPEQYVSEQIDRLVDALGNTSVGPVAARAWTPSMSVWESAEELVFTLDLPGVSQDTVRMRATRGVLEVTGKRMPRLREGNAHPFRLRYQESPLGEFRRLIPLTADADVDRMEGHMRDGSLEIHLPRRFKPTDSKSIPVS